MVNEKLQPIRNVESVDKKRQEIHLCFIIRLFSNKILTL